MPLAPKLTLIYFSGHGLAARIRIAAAVGGVALEDRREERAAIVAMKPELPFGQVPVLLVSEAFAGSDAAPPRRLAQSSAILRYVCVLGGLHPADPLDAAAVDAALVAEQDAFAPVGCAKYRERNGFAAVEGAALAQVEQALRDEVVPRHLGHLEGALAASATGWVAGTARPSAADFAWGTTLRDLRLGSHTAFLPKEILTAPGAFPRINAFLDRFVAMPAVAAYYAAGP